MEEKEQIEELRAWWSEYGNYVIGGIAIGVLALFGWQYQRSTTAGTEIAASTVYDTLARRVAAGEFEQAERAVAELAAEHPDSTYLTQARLAIARVYMDNNRDEDAANALRAAIAEADSAALAAVARMRLAKILHYQEKYDEVLALLEGQNNTGFTARFAEARGDALTALERYDEARAAYTLALADNGQTTDVTFIQLKLLDLPVAVAEAEPEPDTVPTDGIDVPAAEDEPEAADDAAADPEPATDEAAE